VSTIEPVEASNSRIKGIEASLENCKQPRSKPPRWLRGARLADAEGVLSPPFLRCSHLTVASVRVVKTLLRYEMTALARIPVLLEAMSVRALSARRRSCWVEERWLSTRSGP
jgi:hypothetical protein